MKVIPVVTTIFLFSCTGFAAAQGASCYNSTVSILQAQLADPPIKDFKICPATTISIGIPTNIEFTEFAGGDIPLTVIHDDVTIQCGENGDPSDECSLSGGFVQFVTTAYNPFVPDRNISTNNLLLKGLTFTGEVAALPTGTLLGSSVLLSAPGTGMVIEDCFFKELSGDRGVIAVSNSRSAITPAELYPPFSSEVTLKGCTFHNVVHGYFAVGNTEQTMRIQGANFSEITYQDIGDNTFLGLEATFGLVANLGGVMELSDSTFEASQVVYAVAHWYDKNSADVESTFEFVNNESRDIVFVNATDRENYCEEGMLKYNHDNSTFGDCVDLFGQGETPSSAHGFSVILGLLLSVGSIFVSVM